MFVSYEVARQLVTELRPVVETLKRFNRDAEDQLVRAGTSLLLNLGEGARRQGRDQNRFYVMAYGSAGEVKSVFDAAACWGWPVDITKPSKTLDRLLGLLWGLTHRTARTAANGRSTANSRGAANSPSAASVHSSANSPSAASVHSSANSPSATSAQSSANSPSVASAHSSANSPSAVSAHSPVR